MIMSGMSVTSHWAIYGCGGTSLSSSPSFLSFLVDSVTFLAYSLIKTGMFPQKVSVSA